jgi:hypothetical protein
MPRLKVGATNKVAEGIYQFLPECLSVIATTKTVSYKGRNIKTAFIIDLAHSVLLRRHFSKTDLLPISSQVLKATYGRDYKLYLDYLVYLGMLSLQSDYSAGNRCRLYRINRSVYEGPTTRHVNTDPWLIKKRAERKHDLNEKNGINPVLKMRLVANLKRAEVDHDAAIIYLSTTEDRDTVQRNTYSIDSVRDGHLFWHFDDYGRFHSNFTIMKAFIRQTCLSIDGEPVCEIDIPNSQPLFLALMMINDKGVDPLEYQRFLSVAREGKFYDLVTPLFDGGITRSEVKKAVYHVLFGKNRPDAHNKAFRGAFPSVHDFILRYKKEHKDYKSLAYALQRAESDFVYNCVLVRATTQREDLGFITVHDSILVKRSDEDFLRSVFDGCMTGLFRNVDNLSQT